MNALNVSCNKFTPNIFKCFDNDNNCCCYTTFTQEIQENEQCGWQKKPVNVKKVMLLDTLLKATQKNAK